MIASVLSFIGGLFRAVGEFFVWLNSQRLIDAGRDAQRLEDMKEQADAARKADAVRDAANQSGGVRDDDGFRRD